MLAAGSVTLADGERLMSGSRAVRLAIKEGRVVLAPHTQLGFEVEDDGSSRWYTSGAPGRERAGEAWFERKRYELVVAGCGGAVVRTLGAATFVVRSQVSARPVRVEDRVAVLRGKVEVSREAFKARADPKCLVLAAGFETFVTTKGYERLPGAAAEGQAAAQAVLVVAFAPGSQSPSRIVDASSPRAVRARAKGTSASFGA